MAPLFDRVRRRVSRNQAETDPHTWNFPSNYSISSSSDKVTVVPPDRELRNAFIPAATYSSPKEAFIYPDTSHAAVHLCLLECFRNLRNDAVQLDLPAVRPPKYVEGNDTGEQLLAERLPESEHWQILVQLATTRFTTWWNNIDAVLNHGSMYITQGVARGEVQLSTNYLPPLDVLMVWYSLMLDNGEYDRVCTHAADRRLRTLCFPWPAIRDVINRDSMTYELPRAASNLFTTISEQEADILKYLDTPPAYSETSASPFHIDLVAQVHLQQPFIDASHEALWIRSPALHGSLGRATVSYLMAQSNGSIVRLSDDSLLYGTELIWRTHRLFPARYSAYSQTSKLDDSPSDLKNISSVDTSDSSSSTSDSDICICWICERIRDDALHWRFDKVSRAFNLATLRDFSADQVRQIQDDVGFYRAVEKNRRAGLPLPTRPRTAAEKEIEKLEAKKKKEAGYLPGLYEYIEVLPDGRRKIRIDKSIKTAYAGWGAV